ncbi:hypothetical protein MMC26_006008 [Xylographa opegraphella]|nr:hypothetical protein [Xylographa opegraphella]
MEIGSIAHMPIIDIGRLNDGDEEEAAKLFEAAKEDGIFYLNLQDRRFVGIIDTVDEVFDLATELFDLSDEEKMQYDVDKLSTLKLNGYKPVGRNFGGINGNRDGFESYAIPGKAHLNFSFARPSVLTRRLPSLIAFFSQTHQILALLLSSLSSSLKLPPHAWLTNLHRSGASSSDILRLLHYLPQPSSETGVPQTPHTDLGSLSLLFSKIPGLQVMPPRSTNWAYVVPKKYCAIVNIGDGRAMEERYSIVYLQRAEDDVKMEALPGTGTEAANGTEVYTSREWLEKKFGMLRRESWKDGVEGQRILTGKANPPPV